LIPEENVKDLSEIPDNVKNHLEIIPVRWIDRVLEVALQDLPTPLSDEEVARLAAEAVARTKPASESSGGDRKSGVSGNGVSVRVDPGGRSITQNKKQHKN